MTALFIFLPALLVPLAALFLLARPLALIGGFAGGLFAAFRLVNALVGRDWPVLLRDALLTAICAALYYALLILTA